ncbi:hypothetical protein J19TS2_17810 [Cohnella xylanilytica]|nr:hypothetical protein J19TS2_17810 [Cohnella xylanilytica]
MNRSGPGGPLADAGKQALMARLPVLLFWNVIHGKFRYEHTIGKLGTEQLEE